MSISWINEDHLKSSLTRVFPKSNIKFLPSQTGSENRHAIVYPKNGNPLFLKIYASLDRFETEKEVNNLLGEFAIQDHFILAERADITDGIAWLAFPMLGLTATTLSMQTAVQYGELMAMVHSSPLSTKLEVIKPAFLRVEPRLQLLKPFPLIFERCLALWERVHPAIDQALAAYTELPVLLQNDFGERNIFVRRDTGQMVIIDFERAGVGDTLWELGKLWDRELYEKPSVRSIFLDSYREKRGLLQNQWPYLPALWLVRFVATLAIFPYATRVRDSNFFEHGLFKLGLIEQDISAWC